MTATVFSPPTPDMLFRARTVSVVVWWCGCVVVWLCGCVVVVLAVWFCPSSLQGSDRLKMHVQRTPDGWLVGYLSINVPISVLLP